MGGDETILLKPEPLLKLEIRIREQRKGAVWLSIVMNGNTVVAAEYPKGEEALAFVRDYMAGMCQALDEEKTRAVGEMMRRNGV